MDYRELQIIKFQLIDKFCMEGDFIGLTEENIEELMRGAREVRIREYTFEELMEESEVEEPQRVGGLCFQLLGGRDTTLDECYEASGMVRRMYDSKKIRIGARIGEEHGLIEKIRIAVFI